MVLPVAYALMALGAKRRYDKDKADEARQSEDDAERREEREFRRGERQRLVSMRRDIADAAAPRIVEDATVYQPAVDDQGVPMLPNPTEGTFKVSGEEVDPTTRNAAVGAAAASGGPVRGTNRYTDRQSAQMSADKANTGKTRTARMAGTLEKHGEIDKAAAVRSSARQEEVADLQLDEMKAQKLTREYDRRLYQVPDSHDAVAAFISETMGDGQGGAVKTKAVTSPDGKTVTYHQLNADGSTTPTPYTFPATREGVITAKFMLSQGVSPKDKLDHLLGTAKTEEERQRWQKEFGLREDAERRRGVHESRMLTMAERSASAAERAAENKEGAVATPDSTFDAKTAADIAKDQVQKEADAARDAGTPWTGAMIARRTDEIVQSLRQSHAARFIEEAVGRSLAAAQADPAQYQQAYAKAVQLGMNPQKLAALGFKPPAGMRAGPTMAGPTPGIVGMPGTARGMPDAPATPAAAAVAPVAAAGAPGATQKPGLQQTGAEQFADMLAANITTPQGKAKIAQHVQARLPAIQGEISQHTRVMAMPLVSGPVKAKLKEKIDALAQEAQMMQAFVDGNPGV